MSHSTLTIKHPVTISGLTPGTSYVFQARAVTKAGFTDWAILGTDTELSR
jgi:hypothetical protein